MHRTERSKVGHLARAGLALAAFLMLLPAPGRADTLNATDDAFVNLDSPGKNFGSNEASYWGQETKTYLREVRYHGSARRRPNLYRQGDP